MLPSIEMVEIPTLFHTVAGHFSPTSTESKREKTPLGKRRLPVSRCSSYKEDKDPIFGGVQGDLTMQSPLGIPIGGKENLKMTESLMYILKQLIYAVCCVLILDMLIYDMDVCDVIRCSDI